MDWNNWTINFSLYCLFLFQSQFPFYFGKFSNFIGIISNLFLIYIYKKTQLSDRSASIFLFIDIFQLSFLIYLTGGVANPFVIFLIIPSVFASSNLGLRTNLLLVINNNFGNNFFNFLF